MRRRFGDMCVAVLACRRFDQLPGVSTGTERPTDKDIQHITEPRESTDNMETGPGDF